MPMYRIIAVSGLLWLSNVKGFVPQHFGASNSRTINVFGRQSAVLDSRRPSDSRPSFSLNMATQSPPELNFYKILGVSRTAKVGEIKSAYRRLAKMYHPDLNPKKDTTEQFQALNRAYEVLSDPGLKKNYDMFGGRGIGTSAASDHDVGEEMNRRESRRRRHHDFYEDDDFFPRSGRQGRNHHSGPVDFDSFAGKWNSEGSSQSSAYASSSTSASGSGSSTRSSKWDNIGSNFRSHRERAPINMEDDEFVDEHFEYDSWFGEKKKEKTHFHPRGPIVGDDLVLHYEIDFKTAVLGGVAEVTINRIEACSTCDGSGARPGSKKTTCETCGGSGVSIPVNRHSGPVFSIACPDCNGTGERIHHPCDTCGGTAVQEKTSKVKIDIPAGVMDGNKMRIRGEGDVGPNAGPAGDLFLFLKVKEDPLFRREGSDIFADTTISCQDAILGKTMKVPVIDGEATVEIPPGTQPGHVICVKGSGAPSLIANERGDHFVTIEVEIPNGEKDKDNELVQLLNQKEAAFNSSSGSLSSPSSSLSGTSNDSNSSISQEPHNFSVPFPPSTTPTTSKDETAEKAKLEGEPHAIPTSSASSQPKAAVQAATPSKMSTMIDNNTLTDLKEKAAEAAKDKEERVKFEELAKSREKEIQDHRKELEELRAQAEEDRKHRERLEELVAKREDELKESARRQAEMNQDIVIRVQQQQGQTTRITVKKGTPMSKLFDMIARQKGLRTSDLKFSFHGKEVMSSDTPFDLNMENNCLVGVQILRQGGGVGQGIKLM